MHTSEQTNFNSNYLGGELDGLEIIRISVGTFAGTQERFLLAPEGQAFGFDTGSQGGGQN
jgi:hypothetical protein